MSNETPEQVFERLNTELIRVTNEVKNYADDIKKRSETGQKVTDELKKKADESLTAMNGLSERLREIEQKMARRGDQGGEAVKSIGTTFVENEGVREFMEKKPSRGVIGMSVKAITSVTGNVDGNGGLLVTPQVVGGVQQLPARRLTVRDLLAPGRTNSNAIQYVQESGFTNNAAPVAEGAQKPESTIRLRALTVPVVTIAHWIMATKQILDDAPQLASLIDNRLRYGLAYAEELQLLNGDGTGNNIDGLIANATAYNAPITISGGGSMFDKLRLAMLQAVLAEYPATGHVLNPIDWARLELEKDAEGRYIIGDPQGTAERRLWGLPVVETQAMAVDKFLTGSFRASAQVFDREDANVEISTEDRDNFIKNMVTVRGEERLALAIYRPEGLIYGDFGNVP